MKYILNKLFGWQYAIVSFGHSDIVMRIHTALDGTKYCYYANTLIPEGERGWKRIL